MRDGPELGTFPCLGTELLIRVAGRIFDATGSYTVALSIAAGMALLAPALLWVVAPRRPNPPPAAWA